MRLSRIIKTHLVLVFLFGLVIGIAALTDPGDETGTSILAIPVGILVVLLGYGLPVLTGALIVWLLNKKFLGMSMRFYLISYYVLVVLFFLQLWQISDQTDSGFAILALPLVPLGALISSVLLAVFRYFFHDRSSPSR